MRKIFTLLFTVSWLFSFAQNADEVLKKADEKFEENLKQLAEKYNSELKGREMNGVYFKFCKAQGNTLIWQYEVPSEWYQLENGKANIIANFKQNGSADLYFQKGINIEYQYFTDNKFRAKFHIKSEEFADTETNSGSFINIKGHHKSRGVDLKFKVPLNWIIEEGDRPHVVKKVMYETNGLSNTFLITITDNFMFVSRNEARELFANSETRDKLVIEFSNELFSNPKIHNHRLVSIDKYPVLEFTISGQKERAGINMSLKIRCWYIFYEDKIIVFQAASYDNGNFEKMEPYYTKIINSVIFPEQYER